MRERVLLALMCAVFLRIPVVAAGQSPQTSTAVVMSNAAIYASPDAALPPPKSDAPSQVATPAPVAPKSEPASPCVIVKIYQKKAADAFIRWTVPKPYNFVEGDFPRGFKFRSELNDAHVREVQGLGGRVVVMRPDCVLEDLEDARRSCRATSH